MQYHELLGALAERGCAVCRWAEESVEDAISAILHEQVNDASFRQELLASGGFCHPHAWRLVGQHDILGTAILYRALLSDAGRHRKARVRCLLCVSYVNGERLALDTFERTLGVATFADTLARSDGLCDGHFELALGEVNDKPRLRQVQRHVHRMPWWRVHARVHKPSAVAAPDRPGTTPHGRPAV